MRRLLVLMAAPLLFAAGCSSSSGTPTAAPTAGATSAAPATEGTGNGGAAPTKTVAPTKEAGTSRCHTGDLKLTLGEGDGAAGTTYAPLIFKNVSDRTCTL